MNLKNLICNFCEENFDNYIRTPRMIYECGHSICTICLENFLENKKNKEYFFCPKDKKKISLVNSKLENFPKNFSLLMILEKPDSKKSFENKKKKYKKNKKKKKKSFNLINDMKKNYFLTDEEIENEKNKKNKKICQSEKNLINLYSDNKSQKRKSENFEIGRNFVNHENNQNRRKSSQSFQNFKNFKNSSQKKSNFGNSQTSENFEEKNLCLLHNVKLELICIECEEKICYQCGLFGNHKNHKVEKREEFIKKSNSIIKKIKGLKKEMDEKINYIKNFYYKEKVKPKLNEKKFFLEEKIKKLFFLEKKKLEKEEKKILKENSDNFFNFKKFYEEKMLKSFDFINEIKTWENETKNFLYKRENKISKISKAFFILKKNHTEDFLEEGNDLIGKLICLENSYDKKIFSYLEDLQIEKLRDDKEKFLNLINPLLNFESQIINSNFGFEKNFEKNNFGNNFLNNYEKKNFGDNLLLPNDNFRKNLLLPNDNFEFGKKKSFSKRKSFQQNFSRKNSGFIKYDDKNINLFNDGNKDIKLDFFNLDKKTKILKNSKSSKKIKINNILKKSPNQNSRQNSRRKKSNSNQIISKKRKSITKLFSNTKKTQIDDLKKNNLVSLNLKNSEITINHLKSISTLLYKASNLKEIDLSKNNLNDDAIKILFKILSNTKIRRINLSQNSIKDKGLKLIKQLCIGNKNIISVNIKHNLCGLVMKDKVREDMQKLGIDFQT